MYLQSLKEKGKMTSVNTNTLDAENRQRKSAAASSQPVSKQEQPSMNMVIVKFGVGKEWGKT